ncbi:protein kinase UbiB [bacterium HR29]|nr:protein kinase UbiB [bacterium HR29]
MPPRPLAVIRGATEEELGASLESFFVPFEAEPTPVASLAQGRPARLRDRREVAVKLPYPEVADMVRLDRATPRADVLLGRAVGLPRRV